MSEYKYVIDTALEFVGDQAFLRKELFSGCAFCFDGRELLTRKEYTDGKFYREINEDIFPVLAQPSVLFECLQRNYSDDAIDSYSLDGKEYDGIAYSFLNGFLHSAYEFQHGYVEQEYQRFEAGHFRLVDLHTNKLNQRIKWDVKGSVRSLRLWASDSFVLSLTLGKDKTVSFVHLSGKVFERQWVFEDSLCKDICQVSDLACFGLSAQLFLAGSDVDDDLLHLFGDDELCKVRSLQLENTSITDLSWLERYPIEALVVRSDNKISLPTVNSAGDKIVVEVR